MSLKHWSQIAALFAELKDRCEQAGEAAVSQLRDVPIAAAVGDLRMRRSGAVPATFVRERAQATGAAGGEEREDVQAFLIEWAKQALEMLRTSLAPAPATGQRGVFVADVLRPDEALEVLVPLAIYFDQLIAAVSADVHGNGGGSGLRVVRPTLQQIVLKIDDGGERFYSELDRLLDARDPLPLAVEVYYMCLKDGFLGRYEIDDPRRRGYLERLEERIVEPDVPRLPRATERARSERSPFPLHYYVRATAVVFVVFALLWCASRVEIIAGRATLSEAAKKSGSGDPEEPRALGEVLRQITPCPETP